ncbi:MAG TPA: LamG domain-containing protein [Kofleriaceae bacterium]|nr:LamG domain-containing protein [Kofleriaceae bacterium]
MRGLPLLVLAAGCYAPEIPPGGACLMACPGDLVCIGGTCMNADGTDPSLVAHWKFDDPPDDRDGALDSSGRGHHATCRACPDLVTGKIGGGYRFKASLGHILVVPDHADFRGLYTIAAWIHAQPTNNQIAIMSKPYGSGTGNSWQLELLEDDRISLSGGSPHSLRSPGTIPPGEWHHVAGRFDGTEKELFIDGKEVDEVDVTIDYDGHDIYLGGDQNGGDEVLHWDGVLDDVRIYNRDLTDDEIAALALIP